MGCNSVWGSGLHRLVADPRKTSSGHGLKAPVWSRGRFLRRALAAGAAAAGAGVLVERTAGVGARPSASLDQRILNFGLLLEHLQADFYTDALARGGLRGELREFAETCASHERAHAAALRDALGRAAREKPRFRFGDATRDPRTFARVAHDLENLGVAAYNAQAANLTTGALAQACSIVSVEGRHAAWISDLTGRDPAPAAADPGLSADRVAARVRATGFLVPG